MKMHKGSYHRLITILFLGFSSGLPLALTASTLQAWLALSGVSVVAIGFFTLVGQPYVYKFMWAPLLDRYVPPLLGRRRGWILIFQVALSIVILYMATLNPAYHAFEMGILAFIIAFLSASQDIAINAYTTDILLPSERGLGTSMTVTGYRVALLVSGALALLMANYVGWRTTYSLMALLILVNTLVTWIGPQDVDRVTLMPRSLKDAVIEPFRNFLSRPAAISILLFIVFYKLGDAFVGSLNMTFLLRILHFDLVTIGAVNKVGGFIATILGTLLGGILLPRLNLFRALWWFGVLQALSIVLYLLLAIVGKNYFLMVAAIIGESFFAGMATAAFVAFVMTLCDHRYTATQFALLTAVSAIGRVFVGPIAGMIASHFGWVHFFACDVFSTVPGLMLLLYLRKPILAFSLEEASSPQSE